MPLTNEEIRRIVQEWETHKDGPSKLEQLGAALQAELEAKLLAEGVPPAILLYMRAKQAERRALREIARQLIIVEPMPEGALPIYDKDPEVAKIVVEDEDDELE